MDPRVNWDRLPNFSPDEFPPGEIEFVSPIFLYTLQRVRDIYDAPIHPSTALGSFARFDITAQDSRHYAVDRMADAGDIFPDGSIHRFFVLALQHFKGVGVYFDTHRKGRHAVMFHVDQRQKPAFWFREQGEYFYPITDLDPQRRQDLQGRFRELMSRYA